MTHRLLIPLLMLCAFVSLGTEAEGREAAEQAVPPTAAMFRLSVSCTGMKRPAIPCSFSNRSPENAGGESQRSQVRVAGPIPPHRRPDTTRGDPGRR